MGTIGRLNYVQKHCLGRTGLFMKETGQLREGARLGIALSGGVDSMLMTKLLLLRRQIVPFSFELMVLHVNPGFDTACHAPIAQWCAANGLAAHFEVMNIGPEAHSEKNRKKSPCFYCAWFRRKKLFELCKTYRLSHLAFGHTGDDLVATLFMNMTKTATMKGMSGRSEYFGGELTLIRPMLLLHKKEVIKAARAWDLPVVKNPCPSSGSSERAAVEQRLHETFVERKTWENVFRAVTRWQLDSDRLIL
ncbi:PP-loop domain protein [Desulfovibrio sp. X2]|uniref:tRNA lysidine(34) synthetase n=1 Tax=Desulfovibrio sp. X2 TaxID=941449 RepID=UPI000358D175|nr:tRNA 2-thiocytidine biosynthesis TtcA family protein [Desulfovibrio sp. X2]EPR42445.1 PP-loop domain protein [Desulfovibrio sp. X2]